MSPVNFCFFIPLLLVSFSNAVLEHKCKYGKCVDLKSCESLSDPPMTRAKCIALKRAECIQQDNTKIKYCCKNNEISEKKLSDVCMTLDKKQGKCTFEFECTLSGVKLSNLNERTCGIHSRLICCPLNNKETPLKNDLSKSKYLPSYVELSTSVPYSKYLPSYNECGNENLGFGTRIYNGKIAELLDFPWMALLLYKYKSKISFNCGGFLISKRYVLTAAHCVTDEVQSKHGKLKYIRLGEFDIRTTYDTHKKKKETIPQAIDVKIEGIIPHIPNSGFDNDIALIRLKHNVRYSRTVQPICLPNKNIDFTNDATEYWVAGWGKTEGLQFSDRKRKAIIVQPKFEVCELTYQHDYPNFFFDSNKLMCLASKNQSDTCFGDSGGPIMIYKKDKWFAVGIISHGYMCGSDVPNLNTKINNYIEWILKKLRP